jgi:leucyl-tRNA synthetase
MYSYSPYIRENVDFLKQLAANKSDRKKNALLLQATSDQILAIVEICANVLKYNFSLTEKQKRKLAKFADYYRALSRARTERSARNRLQQGSGVALAAILAPIVGALAERLIQKVTGGQ